VGTVGTLVEESVVLLGASRITLVGALFYKGFQGKRIFGKAPKVAGKVETLIKKSVTLFTFPAFGSSGIRIP